MKLLAVVGRSGSGKTTLLEKVVAELVRRGRRVGVIKHTKDRFEMDHEGKDTWRLRRAGAQTVAIVGPAGHALVADGPAEPYLLAAQHCAACHYVLVEGDKGGPCPKVAVLAAGQTPAALGLDPARGLCAVVTPSDGDCGVPRFAPDEAVRLADFIEAHFANDPAARLVEVFVDGQQVPLNTLAQDRFSEPIFAMLKTLRGVNAGTPGEVSIRLRPAPRR
jgi:molybdopterin-guanine dinucleotide biosynthesis protein MobB